MKRRQFVAGASTLLWAAQTGVAQGDEAQTYDALESDDLPSEVSVAWIVDRFVQVRSENAPVVGADVTAPAYVLERATTAEEYEVLRDRFDWEDVDHTGTDAFSRLFSAVSWPLDGTAIPSDVFESYDLLWLTGIHSDYYAGIVGETSANSAVTTDREFTNLYGHVPLIFGLVPKSQSVEAGSAVTLEATVEHANDSNSELTTGSGGYLLIDDIAVTDTLRTPDPDWRRGSTAEFTGIQHQPRPRLSSSATDVDYDDDMPRPQGGSLVTKEGTVESAGDEPSDDDRATKHELRSDSHDVLVGDTLHWTWEDDDDVSTIEDVNVSLVVDTSGSMSERDTGWARDDGGGEKSRLEAAQESLHEFVDFIEDDNRVSLVEFGTSANVVTETTVMDDDSRQRIRDDVDQLYDSGQTTIGGGLRQGMETIVDESGPKSMVLLSDGEENQPPYVDEVLPELRNHGIEVYTIGIGDQIDETQLEYIAEQTYGKSLSATDPGAVRDFYRELMSDTQDRADIDKQSAEVDEGDTLDGDCSVDSSCEDVQFVNTYEGSEMELTVTDPDGNEITETGDVSHRVGDAHEVWTIQDPPSGEWNYHLDVLQVDDPQQTTVRVNAASSVDAELFVSTDLYEQTGFVRFRLKVEEGLERYAGAGAYLEVRPPNGDEEDVEEIPLYDDGGGPDDVGGDGIYSNYYHPTEAGEFEVTAVVEGGEYTELERHFDDTVEIDTVVDEPIRPYEVRRGSRSLLDDPFRLGLLGGVTLGSGWLFRPDDDDATDGAAQTPDLGSEATTEIETETGAEPEPDLEAESAADADADGDAADPDSERSDEAGDADDA